MSDPKKRPSGPSPKIKKTATFSLKTFLGDLGDLSSSEHEKKAKFIRIQAIIQTKEESKHFVLITKGTDLIEAIVNKVCVVSSTCPDNMIAKSICGQILQLNQPIENYCSHDDVVIIESEQVYLDTLLEPLKTKFPGYFVTNSEAVSIRSGSPRSKAESPPSPLSSTHARRRSPSRALSFSGAHRTKFVPPSQNRTNNCESLPEKIPLGNRKSYDLDSSPETSPSSSRKNRGHSRNKSHGQTLSSFGFLSTSNLSDYATPNLPSKRGSTKSQTSQTSQISNSSQTSYGSHGSYGSNTSATSPTVTYSPSTNSNSSNTNTNYNSNTNNNTNNNTTNTNNTNNISNNSNNSTSHHGNFSFSLDNTSLDSTKDNLGHSKSMVNDYRIPAAKSAENLGHSKSASSTTSLQNLEPTPSTRSLGSGSHSVANILLSPSAKFERYFSQGDAPECKTIRVLVLVHNRRYNLTFQKTDTIKQVIDFCRTIEKVKLIPPFWEAHMVTGFALKPKDILGNLFDHDDEILIIDGPSYVPSNVQRLFSDVFVLKA